MENFRVLMKKIKCMKTTIKQSLNHCGILLLLAAAIFSGCSCSTSKPPPDPLAGFHAASKNPDQAIAIDYQNYIQKLSLKKSEFVGSVNFLEDGTGLQAIDSAVGISGRWWRHVLIYDKENKRIKVVVSKTGKYQS